MALFAYISCMYTKKHAITKFFLLKKFDPMYSSIDNMTYLPTAYKKNLKHDCFNFCL